MTHQPPAPQGYYDPADPNRSVPPTGFRATAPMLPVQPEQYHHFWHTPGIAIWRPIVILVLAPIGFLLTTVVALIATMAFLALTGGDVMAVMQELGEGRVGPETLVANMAGLALLVPLCFLLALLAGQRPGFLSSVIGRFRWGLALLSFGVSLVAIILAFVLLTLFAPESSAGGELQIYPHSWALLAILMLVTPLQAAGEEYLLRGLAFRGLASLLPWRRIALVFGAVATSGVFMLIHGASDPWLNVIYFCMGMLFCYLTWRTGGIEAAVAMHAANNIVGMVLVPFQDFSDMFERTEGTGSPALLIQLALLVVATVVIELIARRRGEVFAHAPAAQPPASIPVTQSGF